METDWRGRNVRIFPGWDALRRAPFVEGHVVSLRPAMWVVRDAEGVEQEWPVTLPIEEADAPTWTGTVLESCIRDVALGRIAAHSSVTPEMVAGWHRRNPGRAKQ